MNKINELLNIEYPIISAAMNWVTSAAFVAAVSNAGGMGVLGPNAGQTLNPNSLEEYADNVRNEIRKVKQLTTKNFAVNYIFPFDDSGNNPFTTLLFNILIEEEVKYVVAIGSQMIPSEMVKLKKHGITVLYRPITPTVENIMEAEKHGADAVIVTGSEAGGHISQYNVSLFTLLPQVTAAVSIPVIAAGGIIDGRGAKAAFAMGAQGVYMGTRFIATVENPASRAAKQAIVDVKSHEMIELEGVHERTIPTPGGITAHQLIKEGKAQEAVPYHKNGYKEALLLGNLDQGTISVSPSAGGIQEILTCQEVIDEIVNHINY
ncbi:nitronate monooxygenase [Paenibacillus sp. ACRSA]|uniref:NAD(P)H-dependent flavin oxidoreductase n=1 Tax=Paenibacillus sp. ACRSA TaxID=2918211 RepID=UPI001EF6BE62|nr:nitronate monooxygenase [Paenibacillus sp. ACRSA]MCG7378809.1 nitronate monooxygenase [Paenibacillus sp. ACRSA]